MASPDAAQVAGRDVWLVHPWALRASPSALPENTLCLGVYLEDFYSRWPWSEKRWHFVDARMAALAPLRWYGSADALAQALQSARSVRTLANPHGDGYLQGTADLQPNPCVFGTPDVPYRSFSPWWARAPRLFEISDEGQASLNKKPVPATQGLPPR